MNQRQLRVKNGVLLYFIDNNEGTKRFCLTPFSCKYNEVKNQLTRAVKYLGVLLLTTNLGVLLLTTNKTPSHSNSHRTFK